MADNTMVGVAVPSVRDTFSLGVTALQWVVAGYVVAFAALLFTGGVIGDRYGRKRALVAGIALFAVGAIIAATAWDWRVLVAGRVVQGIGAACSEPGTLSLLRHLHPDEHQRLRVLGGWAAASGLALAAGPVAAGLLLGVGGWRAVFVAEAVAAVAAGAVGAALLPESADPVQGRGDLRGQACLAVALATTTFALIDGQDRGFGSAPVVTAWVIAAAALVGFLVVERRQDEPVVDLALLRDRVAAAGLLAAATSTFALFAVLLLVSLELQIVGDYGGLATAGGVPPLAAGVGVGGAGGGLGAGGMFAPMTAAMVVTGPIGGRWASRRGPSGPLLAGLALATVSCALLDLTLSRPIPVVVTIATLTGMGAGFGLVVAPVVGTVLARVPGRRSGMGAAAVTAAREMGGVLGIAVLGAIVNGMLISGLTDRLVRLGIPVSYREIVVDAVRHGAPLPQPEAPHGNFLERTIQAIKQNLTDQTVDAGKAAYVDSLRTALVVAVCVLAAGAVGVWLLLRNTDREQPTR